MSDLRVYGWSSFRYRDGKRLQTREIVAAKSPAEVMRIAGLKRSDWTHSGSQTWNDAEIATATAKPGVVFWQSIYAIPGDEFYEAVPESE